MPLGCGCNSPRSGWIVALTHPQAEPWASSNLQRRGYRSVFPRYLVKRRDPVLRTITRSVLVPLWPGYLFVPHDSRDSWRPINETPGVRAVLRNGNQIQWLNAGDVEAVMAGEAFRATHMPDGRQWASGDACTPRVGIFLGHPAVVMEVADETVRIGLMFLGELRQIIMPIDCIAPRTD